MSIDAPSAYCSWRDVGDAELRPVRGILTDIDDTLTRAGHIEPAAARALVRLHEAGVPVVAITGRPMGWSLRLARQWPLRAIVAENGSVAILPGRGRVRVEFCQDRPTREANAQRLRLVAHRLLQDVPGAVLARDSHGRMTDIAVDHSEHNRLGRAEVSRVVAIMQEEGLTATVSSIHINGWLGDHNKWRGAQWIVKRLWRRDLPQEREQWIYVGDSTNDQIMFEHFPLSVGVANLLDFRSELRIWPRFVTSLPRGRGFEQVARRLLRHPLPHARPRQAGA